MARKRKARRPYRSKFEQALGAWLDSKGIEFGYETETFKILVPVRGVACKVCGAKEVMRQTRFTPDFFFKTWTIEAKGKFTSNDRKRILALIGAYPKRKFAMLFMRDNKLSKSSETRYSDWCEANKVPYSIGTFKQEWLK